MAEAHTIQKLIYMSLRETFFGVFAQIRKKKAVKNLLEQHQSRPQVQNLIQKGYNIDQITNLAHALLQDQIFQSAMKAKARFPEIFEAPVTSVAAPKMLQSQVTTNDVATTESVEHKPTNANEKYEKNDPEKLNIQTANIKSQSPILPKTPKLTISPDSVRLPFWYQHRIMVQVQTSLEKACFNFALRKLSGIVQANAWDCAEAAELNRWPKILLEHQDKLDQKSLESVEKSFPDLLTSINQIRHITVHRLRLPAKSALDLITDAEALVKLLQDDASIEMISTIRQHVSVAIEDLQEAKRLLELRLGEIEKEYAEKRIQLANEEAALIASTREESKEDDFFANAISDDTLDAIFEAQARWKRRGGISISTDETYGSEEIHEPDLDTEAAYDPIISVEGRAESGENGVLLAGSQLKLGRGFSCPVKHPNADSHDDVAMPTTTCEAGRDHPERPKAVAIFGQSDLCLPSYAADRLPKLSNVFHSPSTSECEYWATPCGSRSPIEEAPAMNGFKDSAATSQ